MKPDVIIATPTHSGDVCCMYTGALLETIALLGQRGFSCAPHFIMNNAIISFARALAAQRFLDSGAEYLFFIDADMWWDARKAVAMVADCPHEFVGGVYPAKTPEHSKIFQTRHLRECATQNYLETDGVPGGFMRLKRSVIEKMVAAYPELKCNYKIDKQTGEKKVISLLFENIIGADGEPLGEDYAFCERWRRLGEKIFIYPDVDFAHYGRGEWRGNMILDDTRLNIVA